MIGSFWNLCRACPSMPVDKQLHSEYRSTYRWHEFTGNARPEVVRRAPMPNPSQFIGQTNEPPLPRRKKCPELAYKSHEFIIGSEYTDARNNANRIARSEERGGTPSRRSKSEGPPAVPNGRAYPISGTEVDGTSANKQAGESIHNGLIKKTISKLSTEYRLQFVWPNVRRIKGHESNDMAEPKKSFSMGAIKSNQLKQHQHQQQQLLLQQHHQQQQLYKQHQQQQHHLQQQQQHQHHGAMPTVHKKRTTNQKEATLHELEPLVSDAEDRKPHEKQVTIVDRSVEKKISARPFSQTFDHDRNNHFITRKENFGFTKDVVDNKQHEVLMNGTGPVGSHPDMDQWFKDVVELRKKAGEYKCRGWGIEIDPELYKKQRDLWDQVSKRSSLSALSLASTMHRPITKEEKEQENNKKSTPLNKAHKPRVPGQAHLVDNKDEMSALPARFSNIRHHLERTTGPDVEEGALLPSPTREKLMPAITKRESESQRGSPKKTAASRHGSPQKGSPQKGSPKKVLKSRSQSVGPGVENESPKRQIRSASTAPAAKSYASGKKTPTAGSTATGAERRARPSTLSTTTLKSRMKSSSLPPPSARAAHSVPAASKAQTQAHATHQANQSHQSHHSKEAYVRNKSPVKPQQPQVTAQAQMRKKDKDRTNLEQSVKQTGVSVGGSSGSGVGVSAGTGSSGVIMDGGSNNGKRATNRPRPKSIHGNGEGGLSLITAKPLATTAAATGHKIDEKSGANRAGISGDGGKATALLNGEMKHLTVPGQDNKLAENDGEEGRETAISVSSCSPQPVLPDEPIVKSPPEPTRVKSPEQIIMRSPDPVNWTVPLDTGKTFTVTQNVKDGESYSRPQSEIKASTPVEKPPPPPQSAPPQLTEQAKMDAWKHSDPISPTAAIGRQQLVVVTSQPAAGGHYEALSATTTASKPVPGTSIRCLEDPVFDVDVVMMSSGGAVPGGNGGNGGGGGNNTSSSSATTSTTTNTASTARTTANDVLEKARDRFDRFWGGNKEDKVDKV